MGEWDEGVGEWGEGVGVGELSKTFSSLTVDQLLFSCESVHG